jgi:hypothetical protein
MTIISKYKKMAFAGIIVSLLAACGASENQSQVREAPDANNRSDLMGVAIQRLADLKTEAQLTQVGWSGDYWATAQGGIAYRWLTGHYGNSWRDYIYPVKTSSQLQTMSQNELDELSPAEKFDLYTQRLDFPLTKEEFNRTRNAVDQSGEVPYWYGICHGWAPAALLEADPGGLASVQGPFGKRINFYSGDLKALTSRLYADARVQNYFLGGRCNDRVVERDADGRILRPECRDTNPASLHLVLADFIGKRDEGFVADVYAGAQVWNQPIIGYSAAISNERWLGDEPTYRHAAQGTVKLVDVQLRLNYLVEASPTKNPVAPNISSKDLAYTLELDSAGYIIGGEWLSEDRTDFLWQLRRKPTEVGDSTLNYGAIKGLLDLSHN